MSSPSEAASSYIFLFWYKIITSIFRIISTTKKSFVSTVTMHDISERVSGHPYPKSRVLPLSLRLWYPIQQLNTPKPYSFYTAWQESQSRIKTPSSGFLDWSYGETRTFCPEG